MNTIVGLYMLSILMMGHAGAVEDDAVRNNEKAFELLQHANVAQVPGYAGEEVAEISHAKEMQTQEEAHAYALSQSQIKADYDRTRNEVENRESIEAGMMQEAEGISAASSTLAGYCGEGDCYQPMSISHEHEMLKSATALEATFGGEKTGGDSRDVRIYTGKAEQCKHDNWKFADCCTDEGWGLDMNLMKCPVETQILGQKKAEGKCHHVGHYEEKKRVGGVVVKIIEYETYCCFPSELANITQVAGREQLGKTWGYKKHVNCEGFTTDEFARIKFDVIDFEGVLK